MRTLEKRNPIAKAIKLALFATAGISMLNTPAAFAAEEEAEESQKITITGSRLTRTDVESASPVTVISGLQMEMAGIQDVGQFLQSSAVMSGSPAMTTTNNGGNGGTFVELRGLGSARTLVLINGRRPISSDFQGIPSSMIERIDVLKDGASAVYGADAVAGVVNIITKKDYEGIEVNLQQSGSFNVGANDQTSFSVIAGKTFDAGNLVFGVDIVEQNPVYQGDVKDVEFFQYPWQVWGTAAEESFWQNGLIGTNDPDSNVIIIGSGSVPCGQFYLDSGGPTQTNDTCDGGIATLADMRDFVGGGPNNDTYNYAPVNYMQTPYKKINVFMEGTMEIADNVTLYSETRINKRTSRQELAAVPYDTRFDPAYKGTTPSGDAFNGVSRDNFYNPFGEDVVRSRRRMLEGGRSFEQDIMRFQQVFGVEGELGETWVYDVSYNYGHSQTVSTDFGQLNGTNLGLAMGPSFQDTDGSIVCGTPTAPIANCVSMNVFGGPGSITQEMLDFVSAPLVDSSNFTLKQLTGFVSGDLMELDAGPLVGGFGVEYREESLEQQVDSGKYLSQVTGNKSRGTSGEFDVTSFFAEFNAPLLESLDLTAGLRYDDFSAFGASTTGQVGIKWTIMDGLAARGTFGTVYRAPTIGNLFSAANDSFPSATDPCSSTNWSALTAAQQANCQADGVPAGGSANTDSQQLAKVGGNVNLEPEEGETFTVGVAYSPDFVDGLSFTVDYWSVELEEVIGAIGAADSLQGCYLGGVAELCENVNRANGEITFITAQATNLSKMTAKGIDFETRYKFEALEGEFNVVLSWTHFLERENQVYNDTTFSFDMEDVVGLYENDTNYATDKMNLSATYTYDNLTLAYASNYISELEYDELLYWGTTDGHIYTVEAQMYHDLTAIYDFGQGTKVSVGITNLTDELPPYIEPAFNGNTDESNYRLFGRSWFVRLNHSF
ncbi:TonB-dependent receptor plug domain-containing protein [Aliikangiella sp. IMCC44653]